MLIKMNTDSATDLIETINTSTNAEKINHVGCMYCRGKDFEAGLLRFNKAIELCPTNALFYFNRCNCYIELSRFKNALQDAEKCVQLAPNFVKGYECRVDCHIALGNLNEATHLLSTFSMCNFVLIRSNVICNQKALLEAYNRLSSVKDYILALEAIDRVLIVSKQSIRFKLMKAETLISLKRFEESASIIREILDLEPNNEAALYVRGKYFLSQDKFTEAIRDFEFLRLSMGKDEFRLAIIQANIAKAKKQASDAIAANDLVTALQVYSMALLIDPTNAIENAKIYFNRSIVLSKLGKNLDAINDCSEAIKLDDKYLKAYLRRAKLCLDSKMFQQAVNDYKKVIEMDSSEEYSNLMLDAMKQMLVSES